MEIEVTVVAFLSVVLIIFGITTGIILWFFSRTRNTANKILSLAIFGITWALIVGFMIETHLIVHGPFPFLYRTGHLAALIFTPLLYLYVRTVVTEEGFTADDIVHIIPAFFFLIDYFPFFILDVQEKTYVLSKHLASPHSFTAYEEGWLTPWWFHYSSRYILMAFYWVLQARLLYRFSYRRGYSRQKHNWLYQFRNIQLLFFFPLVIAQENLQWAALLVAVALPILLTSFWLFFKPEVLYGLHVPTQDNGNSKKSLPLKPVNGQAENYKNSTHDEFPQLVHKQMVENNRFLQHGYTIQDLANDLGMHPHQVSHLLNQQLHISFHDLLNKYRIALCIERISNGDSQRLTLEALSFECGFNNRNSFITAFKRFTGSTPSDYIRSITHTLKK